MSGNCSAAIRAMGVIRGFFSKSKFFSKNAFWEDFVNIGRRGVDTLIPARSGKGLETCDENSINDKNMNSSNARKYGRWLPWTTGMLAFAGLTGTLASTIVFWNVFFGKQQEDIPAFEDFPAFQYDGDGALGGN